MKLIDADALKASYIVTSTTTNSLCHLYVSIEDINNAPSIDIVRCKECRWWIDNLTDDSTDEDYGQCCFDWDIKMPTADDFCSYGQKERRVSR